MISPYMLMSFVEGCRGGKHELCNCPSVGREGCKVNRKLQQDFRVYVCVQAVMGKLLKGHLAYQWGIDPASIYHCAVMPCYDKKLEASREDFNLPGAYTEPGTPTLAWDPAAL